MSFNAGAIVSKLILDKKEFDKSVQDVGAKQKTLGGYVQANSAKFKAMGTKMAIAGGIIVGAFGLMIKKASDAQEITAKFGTVFQDVFPRASKAAKDLANNYGLSTVAAKDMIGATGDLLTGLGMQSDVALTLSEKTQQLAVDLASFTNFSGGASGASEALTKAMLGERESVKSLGIVITEEMVKEQLLKEGKDKLTGQARLQAKAEATLTIAVSQSKNAIGDYARTSDSLANVTRTLKAKTDDLIVSLGTTLIPIATDLAIKVKGVVEKVSDWIKEHPKLTSIIAKAVLGLGALMTVLGPIVMLLPGIVTALPAIAIGIHALLGPLGAVTAAAIAAYKIISKLTKAKSDMVDADYAAAEATHKFGQKLREISDEAGLSRKEFIELTRKYKGNMLALAMAIKRGKEGVKLQKAMIKVGKENVKEYDKQKKGLKKLDEDGFKPLTVTIPEVMEETKTWVDYMADMGLKTVEEKADRVEELEGYIDDLSKAYKDGKIDLQTYTKALNKAKGEIKNLSTSISTTALPAFRDMSGVFDSAVGEMEDRFPDITKTVDIESDKIAGRKDSIWNTMADGLQTKWASTMGELIRGTTSLKDGLKGIWDTVLTQFTDMIGAMVAKWITGFIGNTLSSLVNKFVPGVKSAMGSASGAATGAATSIGASMALAFDVAIVAAWASMAWSFIKGWGDNVNHLWKEQRAQIDLYIAKLKEMGRTWREIKDLLSQEEYVSPRPRPPLDEDKIGKRAPGDITGGGWGSGGGGRWATGFEGIVTQPIRPLIGEAGPEYVSVQPLSGGKPPASSNVTVNNYVNLNGTIITDRDYTRKRLIPEMLSALEANFEKTKMKQILGIA